MSEVTIKLYAGSEKRDQVWKSDIQKNMDAVQRHIENNPQASDFISLIDTYYILKAIQEKLPSKFD